MEKLITLTTAVIKHILSVYVPWLHTLQNQIQVLTNNVHPVLHTLGVMVSAPTVMAHKSCEKTDNGKKHLHTVSLKNDMGITAQRNWKSVILKV